MRSKLLLCTSLILLQSVIYGALDPVAKVLYETVPVYFFLTFRYLLAAVVMLLVWGRRIVRELRTASLRRCIAPSVCMASSYMFSNMALSRTAATNMAFLRSLSALIAPLLLLLFFRQKYRKLDAGLQLGMLAGLYLLCARGGLAAFGAGELLALAAATMSAGALVFGKDALADVSAATLSFLQAGLAAVLCFFGGLFTHSFTAAPPVTVPVLLAVGYAAVFCTVGGYMLQNTALRFSSARTVGIAQCTYPLVTAAMSFLMLHERLSTAGIAGAGIILLCVLLENLAPRRPVKRPAAL